MGRGSGRENTFPLEFVVMDLFLLHKILVLPIRPPYYMKPGMVIRYHLFNTKEYPYTVGRPDQLVIKDKVQIASKGTIGAALTQKDRSFFIEVKDV
jgi:hypothetical protein